MATVGVVAVFRVPHDPGDNRKLDLWCPPTSFAAETLCGVCLCGCVCVTLVLFRYLVQHCQCDGHGDLCFCVSCVCSNKGNSRSGALYGAQELHDCLTRALVSSFPCCSPQYFNQRVAVMLSYFLIYQSTAS